MAEENKNAGMEWEEDEYNFQIDGKPRTKTKEGVLRLRTSSIPSTFVPHPLPHPLDNPLPHPLEHPLPQNSSHTNGHGAAGFSLKEQITKRVTRTYGRQQQHARTENPGEPMFKVISAEQAYLEMQDVIKQVRVVLVVNPEIIRKLLIQFNWDHERLVEAYFEGNDKVFLDTNIPPLAVSSGLYDSLTLMIKECKICYEDKEPKDMVAMLCGHDFCKHCWSGYLPSQIDSCLEQDIKCPQPRCPILLEEPGVRRALQGKRCLSKYYRLMAHSFVECHPKYRWCYPVLTEENHCTKAFQIDTTRCDKIECVCGHISCSDCNDDWHYPIKCSLLRTWRNKYTSLLKENPDWTVNSRSKCPLCQNSNNKIPGNFMRCQNSKCFRRYYLLWKHPYNDGVREATDFARYFPKSDKDGSKRFTRDKFYFYRFMEHEDSLNREKEFKAKVQMRDNCRPVHADTFIKAVEVLAQVRALIMYSYVFAFYARDTEDLEEFVDFQGSLEEETEILSSLLGRYFRRISPSMKADDWIKAVACRVDTVEDVQLKLVDLVNKGYRHSTWKFRGE